MIDKTTGKSSTLYAFPYLSLDKTLLISCAPDVDYWRNDEEDKIFADIQIYEPVQDSVISLYGGQFKNWLPTNNRRHVLG